MSDAVSPAFYSSIFGSRYSKIVEKDPASEDEYFYPFDQFNFKQEEWDLLVQEGRNKNNLDRRYRLFFPSEKLFFQQSPPLPIIVLEGATLLDFSDFGKSHQDIPNSRVLIQGGRILAAGPRDQIQIPLGARIIDLSGKYLVPGLIDGFTGMPNKRHACAHLAMGVTSIVGLPGDERRPGELCMNANPSPHVFPLAYDGIGYIDSDTVNNFLGSLRSLNQTILKSLQVDSSNFLSRFLNRIEQKYLKDRDEDILLSDEEALASLERAAKIGVRVVIIYYPIPPALAKKLADRAKELGIITIAPKKSGIVTIGELAKTSYLRAARECGLRTFVHDTRFTLDLASEEIQREIAKNPFGAPYNKFMKFLIENYLHPDEKPQALATLDQYSLDLGCLDPKVGLMPTLAFRDLDLPGHENPWKSKIASLIRPEEVTHLPADPKTGKRINPKKGPYSYEELAQSLLNIDRRMAIIGKLHFLASSGSTAYGTLPGHSLHQELGIYLMLGLTPREAIATATWNYRELWEWEDLGMIAPGGRADFLVLKKDPTKNLKDLEEIEVVYLDGKPLDPQSLISHCGN